ncbi:MAG TPA: Imm50 family immunity protein [Candidatus Acidoferrum sp.]|nr:Imm50 family immunity protein [Candidatus Acidoferrum sp.]
MSEIAALIAGSEKLAAIFGCWPSFHDAEVHELNFQRGHIDTDAQIYEFPRLTVKLHHWLMTNDIDQKDYLRSIKHTLTTFKFSDVDNFKMEGFNHQNAIFGLGIEQKTREEGPTPYFAVDFEPSFGIGATFTCLRIEIVEAVSCDPEGTPV